MTQCARVCACARARWLVPGLSSAWLRFKRPCVLAVCATFNVENFVTVLKPEFVPRGCSCLGHRVDMCGSLVRHGLPKIVPRCLSTNIAGGQKRLTFFLSVTGGHPKRPAMFLYPELTIEQSCFRSLVQVSTRE